MVDLGETSLARPACRLDSMIRSDIRTSLMRTRMAAELPRTGQANAHGGIWHDHVSSIHGGREFMINPKRGGAV